MAATIPTTEPLQFTAGDSVKWTIAIPDYAASDGNVLSYSFVNSAGAFTESTSTADGDSHAIVITAADSVDFTAGVYTWQAYITTSGSERYQVRAGTTLVKTNYATGAFDSRSHVKKVLDAIEEVIEGRASEDAAALSVAGRSITKMTLEELISARSKYMAQYQVELKAERISAGLGSGSTVRIRFRD